MPNARFGPFSGILGKGRCYNFMDGWPRKAGRFERS